MGKQKQSSTPRRRLFRSLVLTLTLIAVGTLLAALLGELFLRFVHTPSIAPRVTVVDGKIVGLWCCPPLRQSFDSPISVPQANIHFQHCYSSDYKGFFEAGKCVSYRTNKLGFRGRDHSETKPPDTLRIQIYGDSFTFGEGVRESRIYPELLRQEVGQLGGKKVEWMNFGLPGIDPEIYERIFSQAGQQFQPDLIIMQWNTNDILDQDILRDHNRLIGVAYQHHVKTAMQIKWSVLYRYLWFTLKQRAIGDRIARIRTDRPAVVSSIRAIKSFYQRAQTANVKFWVLIFPELVDFDDYPYDNLVAEVSKLLGSHQVPVIDALPLLRRRKADDLWVHPSDHHPNDDAHRIVSDLLRTAVQKDADLGAAEK